MRNRIQTPVLLRAVEKYRFTALFGGARRDEETGPGGDDDPTIAF